MQAASGIQPVHRNRIFLPTCVLGAVAFALPLLVATPAAATHDPGCGSEGQLACWPIDGDFWVLGGLVPDGCDSGLYPEPDICGCLVYLPVPRNCGCSWSVWGHCVVPRICWESSDICAIPQPCFRCENLTRHWKSDPTGGWAYWASMQQRNLARHEPVNWVMHVGTHNSYNNLADGYLAFNQAYSISDQLDMGARSLMLDVHPSVIEIDTGGLPDWVPDWFAVWWAALESFSSSEIRLSHAHECSHLGAFPTDRLFVSSLKEIRDWLEDNPREVIVLNMEEWIHEEPECPGPWTVEPYRNAFVKYLGEFLVKPEDPWLVSIGAAHLDGAGENETFVLDRWPSLAEMTGAGKQVVLQGGMNPDLEFDPYAYGFDGGKVGGVQIKDFAPYTDCVKLESVENGTPREVSLLHSGTGFTSFFEDRSLVGFGVPTGFISDHAEDFPGVEDWYDIADLVDCNVSVIGMDLYGDPTPSDASIVNVLDLLGIDPFDILYGYGTRLERTVWSWAVDEWGRDNQAARLDVSDGRWYSTDPDDEYRFACAQKREGDSDWRNQGQTTSWCVTPTPRAWKYGTMECETHCGRDFSVPVNSPQNRDLVTEADGHDVWLAYRDTDPDPLQVDWDIDRPFLRSAITSRPDPAREGEPTLFEAEYPLQGLITHLLANFPANLSAVQACANALLGSGDTWSFDDGTSGQSDLHLNEVNNLSELQEFLRDPAIRLRVEHVFPDDGSYLVEHEVPPACGPMIPTTTTWPEPSRIQLVENVAPQVIAGLMPDQVITLGDMATIEVGFLDVGEADAPYTARIIWGDGAVEDDPVVIVGPPSIKAGEPVFGTVSADHSYLTCGSHPVTVEVTDKNGARSFDELAVRVTGAPFAITCPDALTVDMMDRAGTAVDLGMPAVAGNLCFEVDLSNDAPELFEPGLHEVIWTARSQEKVPDAESDNPLSPEVSCSQMVYVQDTTSPVLRNVSTRGFVGTADDVMIGGFIIEGIAPMKVLIRSLGPTLTDLGVPGAIVDPQVTLTTIEGVVLGSCNDWALDLSASEQQEVRDSGLAPPHENEPGLIAVLPPGAYTPIVSGVGGATGVGIVEIYVLENPAGARLSNLSTRGYVGSGGSVQIGGFIIEGTSPKKVLVRALGPTLTALGVAGALNDPQLLLTAIDGTVLATNDDWRTGTSPDDQSAIEASGYAPPDAAEPAIVITLAPGAYTPIVSGVEGATGVGIVEIYEIE